MKAQLSKLFLLTNVFLVFSGCYPLIQTNNLRIEQDEVKKSTRYLLSSSYNVLEKNTPVVYFGKTFFKEKDSLGNSITKVFDVIQMTQSTDKIDSVIYLITDDKTFPITLKNIDKQIEKRVSVDTEDILKADSTKVEVVTDYDEEYLQIYRFNYVLTDAMIQAVLNSNGIKFRYYAGLSMITVNFKNSDVAKLKAMLITS